MIRFFVALAFCGPMAYLMQYHDPMPPTPIIGVALLLTMVGAWIFSQSIMLCLIVGGLSLALFADAVTYGHL